MLRTILTIWSSERNGKPMKSCNRRVVKREGGIEESIWIDVELNWRGSTEFEDIL